MAIVTATFLFSKELNALLSPDRRCTRFPVSFNNAPGIKDAIESLGVPHTEVDVILVNDRSVDFSYRLKGGDEVAVYGTLEMCEEKTVIRLFPALPPNPAFIGDVHLGRLCRFLRILGFDTRYQRDYDDSRIVALGTAEPRIILTRDRGVLKHSSVRYGYYVRSTEWHEQAVEVIKRFNLARSFNPFTLCASCNGTLTPVPKSEISDQLEEKTRLYYDTFFRCRSCGKIYWNGSHYQKLQESISRVLKELFS
jgi:uncharacterized protein with PIN domain